MVGTIIPPLCRFSFAITTYLLEKARKNASVEWPMSRNEKEIARSDALAYYNTITGIGCDFEEKVFSNVNCRQERLFQQAREAEDESKMSAVGDALIDQFDIHPFGPEFGHRSSAGTENFALISQTSER